jgi:hypothetical protein
MQNLIELKTEETKAVVGGLARKGPPPVVRALDQLISEVIRDLGGGQPPMKA